MKNQRKQRSGTAVAELAVCLPIIFAIVFGSIEACNMIALKQIISESAYDGALQALKPNASEATVIASINAVLAARGVSPQNVTIEGPGGGSFGSASHGDEITVTVEVLTDGNVVGPQLFGFATVISSQMTAIKQ